MLDRNGNPHQLGIGRAIVIGDCGDLRADVCIGMCVDVCVDMCVDMCVDVCVQMGV